MKVSEHRVMLRLDAQLTGDKREIGGIRGQRVFWILEAKPVDC